MTLTAGLNHIAIVTSDLDRLAAFYCDVFGAQIVQLQPMPVGGRVAIVRIGHGAALNIFEPAGPADSGDSLSTPRRFRQGRLDHFGIAASGEHAFHTLCDQLVTLGCSTGEITDFGPILGIDFTDADGHNVELDLVVDPTLHGGHPPTPYPTVAADNAPRS